MVTACRLLLLGLLLPAIAWAGNNPQVAQPQDIKEAIKSHTFAGDGESRKCSQKCSFFEKCCLAGKGYGAGIVSGVFALCALTCAGHVCYEYVTKNRGVRTTLIGIFFAPAALGYGAYEAFLYSADSLEELRRKSQ